MKYIRYWEDLSRERLIFAEQDAHSYELVQKLFGYTKESSFYLYHKGALGGYFSERDLEVERRVGYAFYSVPENAERVITLKREKRAALDAFVSSVEHADISTLSDVALRDLTLESIRHYYEMLNAHVLTQPQFFELLEAEGKTGEEETLKKLASARFEYTRKGFMLVMESARRLLREFARRNGLCLEEVESMTNEEFRLGRINGADLRGRMETFVLLLERGAQTILTGRDADVYVREYKTIAPVDSVRGVVGNKGYAKGRAFVIKNEEFDYDNLPKGMERHDTHRAERVAGARRAL